MADVTGLQTAVDALKASVDAEGAAIATIAGVVPTLQQNINDLHAQLAAAQAAGASIPDDVVASITGLKASVDSQLALVNQALASVPAPTPAPAA